MSSIVVFRDSAESGETFDLELHATHFEVGQRVAVVKEGDPYFGKAGLIMKVSSSEESQEIDIEVDFGDSDIRSFSQSNLLLLPSPLTRLPGELISAWSSPQKDRFGCQELNNTCLYDGHQFCPNGCGLWLCSHHYQKHETHCPNSEKFESSLEL